MDGWSFHRSARLINGGLWRRHNFDPLDSGCSTGRFAGANYLANNLRVIDPEFHRPMKNNTDLSQSLHPSNQNFSFMKFVKTLVCLSLFLGMTSQSRAYDIRSGVLSYYSFDATTTNDVAFTNNFNPVGAPSLVAGQSGTALSLAAGQY